MPYLTADWWTERYKNGQTGWDIGDISTPLQVFFDQLPDKNLKILIPGAGNAYEALYLWNHGFPHVFVLDWSDIPLQNILHQQPDFPSGQLIHQDFFEHTQQYDLIVEQTFFCALNPELRTDYLKHMSSLLLPGGQLAGLLFNIPLNQDKPPFGGHQNEYLPLFQQYFKEVEMEICQNSIPPRAGNELWFRARNEERKVSGNFL